MPLDIGNGFGLLQGVQGKVHVESARRLVGPKSDAPDVAMHIAVDNGEGRIRIRERFAWPRKVRSHAAQIHPQPVFDGRMAGQTEPLAQFFNHFAARGKIERGAVGLPVCDGGPDAFFRRHGFWPARIFSRTLWWRP